MADWITDPKCGLEIGKPSSQNENVLSLRRVLISSPSFRVYLVAVARVSYEC